MNKFLIMYEELYNLNQMQRIFMTHVDNNWVLWAVFHDGTVELSSGSEKKIKQQFKDIKYFLLSCDDYIKI